MIWNREKRIADLAHRKSPKSIQFLIKLYHIVLLVGILNLIAGLLLIAVGGSTHTLWVGGLISLFSLRILGLYQAIAARQKSTQPPVKSRKNIFAAIGIITLLIAGLAGSFVYKMIYLPTLCADIAHPPRSIKACQTSIEEFLSIKNKNADTYDTLAHLVLWLHLDRMHAGQDDTQEFAANAAPYLNERWPAPVLALYLGRTSINDVYAKAKLGQPSDAREQTCEAQVYAGEWYLLKNMKADALTIFQTASTVCSSDQLERSILDTELKSLGHK